MFELTIASVQAEALEFSDIFIWFKSIMMFKTSFIV